jgi:hypothetical protein
VLKALMGSRAELNQLTRSMRTYKALPKIPSDPERSSSDTSAPTRDTQKDGVRDLGGGGSGADECV